MKPWSELSSKEKRAITLYAKKGGCRNVICSQCVLSIPPSDGEYFVCSLDSQYHTVDSGIGVKCEAVLREGLAEIIEG